MKILLFVDSSFRGEWGVALARDLAHGLEASLILLTTSDRLAADPELLDRAALEIAAGKELRFEKKARTGKAREAIVAESNESRPAITIVPPAGRKGLARVIKGSRVKDVVHNARSNVMVARAPVSSHISRILAAVSGGPMSEATALGAASIARALGAELTLLHVASGVSLPFAGSEPSNVSPQVYGLRELLGKLGYACQLRVREGMVVSEILEECREGGFDLLVLGQHLADRDAGGPFTENIAEVLAVHCPISVLVIRPPPRREGVGAPAGVEGTGEL